MLTALALGGIRILSRVWIQRSERRATWQTAKSVVVVGAGCGAAMLLRELPRSGYTAVALVDDDRAKAQCGAQWDSGCGFDRRVARLLSIVIIRTKS